MSTEHVHELYEDEYPLHCDGCGDSFSALAMLREAALNATAQAETAVRALERIASDESVVYLSCPSTPFCRPGTDDHDEQCAVRIATEALATARRATEPAPTDPTTFPQGCNYPGCPNPDCFGGDTHMYDEPAPAEGTL